MKGGLDRGVSALERDWTHRKWVVFGQITSPGRATNKFHVEHYTSRDVISFTRNGIEWGLSLPT